MGMISFLLDSNIEDEIKEVTDNKSEFIRQAIIEKLGKTDKTLQELAIDLEKKALELKEIEDKYNEKLQETLEHKEQLKIIELEEIEVKIKQKEQKHIEFMQKWNILENEEDIKNFQYIEKWENLANIEPIIDNLRKKGIRIGIMDLRNYLSFRQH